MHLTYQKIVTFFEGKEFVKFIGTTCRQQEDQYGSYKSLHEARVACLADPQCVAFHAVQKHCHRRREREKRRGITFDTTNDFKLCRKNSRFRNEMGNMLDYRLPLQMARQGDNCFHDVYIKSNEPGNCQ